MPEPMAEIRLLQGLGEGLLDAVLEGRDQNADDL